MKRRHSLLNATGATNFVTTTIINPIELFDKKALTNIVMDNINHYAPKIIIPYKNAGDYARWLRIIPSQVPGTILLIKIPAFLSIG